MAECVTPELDDAIQMPLVGRYSGLIEKLKSAGWAISEGLMSPLLQLALTPLLLSQLGAPQYGIWVLGLMLTGIGSLASLGAPVATMKRVAERPHEVIVASKDIKTILSAASFIAFAGTVLIGAVVLGLTMVFNRNAEASLPDFSFWKTALFLSWVALVIQEVDNVISASLKGINRFDLIAKIDVSHRLLWFFAVAGAAFAFGEIALCVFAGTVVSAFKLRQKIKVAATVYKGAFWTTNGLKKEALMDLTVIGKWYWMQTLGAFLFNTADRWLITLLFGLESLTAYAICLQLAQFTHGVQATAGQVIIPWASGKAHEISQHVQVLVKVSLIGGFACLALPMLVALISNEVLSLWIGPEFAAKNEALVLALLLSFAILASNIPLYYVLVGIGRVRLLTFLNVVGGALSLSAGFLTAHLGLVAFALSKSIFGLVVMLAAIPLARRKYD